MKRVQRKRDEFIKGKSLNMKVALGDAYEIGYRDGCRDAAEEFAQGGWLAKADKVKHLPDMEER